MEKYSVVVKEDAKEVKQKSQSNFLTRFGMAWLAQAVPQYPGSGRDSIHGPVGVAINVCSCPRETKRHQVDSPWHIFCESLESGPQC